MEAILSNTSLKTFLSFNEPVVFGCIAWNPILMIPMNLCTIVVAFVAYLLNEWYDRYQVPIDIISCNRGW